MFPRWFDKWNRDNPKDIYGPAILVGAAGSAVFAAALLVAFGQPFQTDSLQTGPAGTGMSVARFVETLNAPNVDAENYFSLPPIPPEEGEPLVRDLPDLYTNVQVLGGLTEANFTRLMSAMTEWVAPDQGCTYCHAGADEGNYADDDLYTKVVARRMIQMTQFLNEEWGAHTNASGAVGVTCYTCHRGQNVPDNIWFRIAPVNAVPATAGWAAIQNRATVSSQFTSLPSDALERYLLNADPINVHDLQALVARADANPAMIQHTERTYSLMNYFSNSLGVNCVFCHNSRAFYDPAQVTPQWAAAMLGIEMVRSVNNDYLAPLQPVYPANRLGPVYGDAPLAACATCHQGQQRPLRGLNVVADWPELVTTGDPVYATE